jgi:Ricin-type beta-trefoil lectin domain-like/Secretion system C-terminal sorting domain
MKINLFQLLLSFSLVGLFKDSMYAQCTNFPKPEITTVQDPTTFNLTFTITNLPAGASSSINNTFTVGRKVYENLEPNSNYNVRIRLGGCESQKEVFVLKRFFVPVYLPGCYRIVNKATGKVLEVEDNSLADGARIRQATYTGAANQMWQQVDKGATKFSFISRFSNHLLDAKDCKVRQSAFDKANFPNWFKLGGGIADYFTLGDSCGKLKASNGGDKLTLVPLPTVIPDNLLWKFEKVPCAASVCGEPAITGSSTVCKGGTTTWGTSNTSSKVGVVWSVLRNFSDPTTVNISSTGVISGVELGQVTIRGTIYDGACITTIDKTITVNDCSTQALASTQIYAAEGYRESKKSILTWVSNAENADYFTIEKLDGKGNFVILDRKNAKPVPDFSTTNFYSYTDNQPNEGENTYRIALISPNAPPQYSALISLNFKAIMDAILSPNPAIDYVDIDLSAYENSLVSLHLTDARGQEVKLSKLEKAPKSHHMDLDNLTTGVYVLRIQSSGKRDLTRLLNIVK